MSRRTELQLILEGVLGSRNVYFQPPPSVQMSYPCIVYERSALKTEFADNNPYLVRKKYQVTVIDKNPDSELPDKVSMLPGCSFDRHFTSDNLNHDAFTLHF